MKRKKDGFSNRGEIILEEEEKKRMEEDKKRVEGKWGIGGGKGEERVRTESVKYVDTLKRLKYVLKKEAADNKGTDEHIKNIEQITKEHLTKNNLTKENSTKDHLARGHSTKSYIKGQKNLPAAQLDGLAYKSNLDSDNLSSISSDKLTYI